MQFIVRDWKCEAHYNRRMHSGRPNLNRFTFTALVVLVSSGLLISGCASDPLAGNWAGELKLAKGVVLQTKGFSETKPTLTSHLTVKGDGTYSANIREVMYTGTWAKTGTKVTLTPLTYMGVAKAELVGTKQATSAGTTSAIFKGYDLEVSSEKTLVHTDGQGVTTFTKSG